MYTQRLFPLLILIVLLAVTACTPQVAPTAEPTSAPAGTQPQSEPITLRLAVADAQDRPSTPYVLEFIEQAKTLSNGSITIEPIWDAGADTTPVFEQGVVKVVKEGQYDLGLAGSRAWDSVGVTSFQALQAPFLITDDALAEAVAASDIGTRMLESLSSAGAVGLALWPEDLRHPFSVVPDKLILSPQDFEGATVRVVPSEVSHMLIETLGGSPIFGDDYQAAESGLRQGFSLTGTPAATGNVIFFPKFQVLFANGPAFEKLSEAQRTIVRQAAAATQQKAIAEHPSEVEAARAWCADGGTVVMASEEQVAAFEAAAQPIFVKIEQDPLTAEWIAEIRELKTNTEAAPGAEACQPQDPAPNPIPTPESQAWSAGLPPNGTWTVHLTVDDFVKMGVLRSVAEAEWAGTYTLTLKDGKSLGVWQGLQGQTGKCQANYEAIGDVVRFTYYTDANECLGEVDDLQWRLDDKGLHFHVVDIKNAPLTEIKAYLEAKPWQKVEEWSTGLPPNGVWQAEITTEDFVRMGVLRSVAETEWAGVYTITFKDGKYVMVWEGLQGQLGRCQADYELVEEDIVRLTNTSDPSECSFGPEEIQWRIDDNGLHLHLVPQNGFVDVEATAFYEAKVWQKVEEWSTGLPPNGVWQVELSAEDIAQFGVLQSTAADMAGTYTWTFQDGSARIEINGPKITVSCMVVATVIEDVVRLQNVGSPTCNGDAYDEVQWRLDDAGLHFYLVAPQSTELKATYEAKPWQKVADQ